MAQTTSSYTNLQTPQQHKDIIEIINQKSDLMSILKPANRVKFMGENQFEIPIKYKQPETYIGTTETMTEPSSVTGSAYSKAYETMQTTLGVIEWNRESLNEIKGGDHVARENAVKAEVEGLLATVSADEEMFLLGNGSGAFATVVSVSGQTVTVDDNQFIREGMVFDGYDASDNKDLDSIVVSSVNLANNTFIATGTLSSADSATVLYKEGAWVTGLNNHVNGLETMIAATGTLHGIDRTTTNAYYRSTVNNGSTPGTNENVTFKRIHATLNPIYKGRRQNNQFPNIAILGIDEFAAVQSLLKSRNTPVATVPAIDGFPETIAYQFGKFKVGFHPLGKCQPNTCWFINNENFGIIDLGMEWVKEGSHGMPPMYKYGTTMVWRSYVNWVHQYFTLNPNLSGRMNDIKGYTEMT